MKKKSFLFYYFLLPIANCLLLIANCAAQPKYEFRAVWIASVDNIDWPPKGMMDLDSQKTEFIRQVELHKSNGMNAVIVQVRPAADAFYSSQYEPWSQWLTGTQGKPPNPYYDPLEFMINETHKRGMEFHAWCNPYRADFKIGASSIAPSHITKVHPEWFLDYGDKKYFDPASKQVQSFVVKVISDIVSRYDVDAIHMDDYFYPYRISGKEFPDDESYKKSGSSLSKDDWRRSNVDTVIRALSIAIKKEKPFCRFGISPFSVWRNKDKDPRGSESQAGQTNYDDLYADILLWLKQGWIDYVAPQLYLEIGHEKIDYVKMLDWWSKNSYGKHLYIGHGVYRAGNNPAWKNPNEIPNQIKLLRQYPNVHGSIYFSSKSFNKNPNGWNDSLRNNYYKTPALIPPMNWIDREKPWAPITEKTIVNDSVLHVRGKVDPRNNVPIKYFVVYKIAASSDTVRFGTDNPEYIYRIIMAADSFEFSDTLSSKQYSYRYLITAVGRNNNESEVSEMAVLVQPDGKWKFY